MRNTQLTANKSASLFSAVTALRNTYQPEDDLGIPKLNEETPRAAEWSRENSFIDPPPQRKNNN